jgi:hypothetical protein
MYQCGIIQPAADLSMNWCALPDEPRERAKAMMVLGMILLWVIGGMM